MRLLSLSIFLCIQGFAFSQEKQEQMYKTERDVISTEGINISDLSNGFTVGSRFENYTYFLSTNYTFKRTGESDVADWPKPDSGYWKFKHGNQLVLKTATKSISYRVVKIGEYYFFISPYEKKEFYAYLKKIFLQCKDAQNIKLDNNLNGTLQLTGWLMSKQFSSKRISAGT